MSIAQVEPEVDVETGEVVEVLTKDQARALTEQIRTDLGDVWNLIKQAYLGRAWVAMGYGKWDEYCVKEFGNTQLVLPREERQAAVASLRDWGLSIRAIAAATGASVGTVASDVASGVQNRTPDGPTEPDIAPPPTTGLDGKQYPSSRPEDPLMAERRKQQEERERAAAARAERDAAEKAAEATEKALHNQARQRYPDVERASITREMSALFDQAADLLTYDAAETAAFCNDLETDVRIVQATALVEWLSTHLTALQSPGASVTNLRSAQ